MIKEMLQDQMSNALLHRVSVGKGTPVETGIRQGSGIGLCQSHPAVQPGRSTGSPESSVPYL